MFCYQKYKSSDQKIYQDSLRLRNELLRLPIGKSIYDEDLSLEKDNDFYGVFQEEQLIGTLSFYEKAPFVAQLTAFAVAENFQGVGLGSKLVAFLIDDLKSQGYRKITVAARATAKDFYQKCGFTILKGPLLNPQLDVIDYEMLYVIKA